MRDIHTTWAWVVIVANAVAGSWALAAHRLDALRGRPLWMFTAAAQSTVLVQVIVGVLLARRIGLDNVSTFHMFYGFIALATIGLIYSYRQELDPWRHLLYGGGGLFIMGLSIRAMFLTPLTG